MNQNSIDKMARISYIPRTCTNRNVKANSTTAPEIEKSPPRNPGAGKFYVFISDLTNGHHENPASAAIDIDQAFAGGR